VEALEYRPELLWVVLGGTDEPLLVVVLRGKIIQRISPLAAMVR
jgi:hypothetical protein